MFEGANAQDRLHPLGCARDLNGDGFAELAVGTQFASFGGRALAGVVNVYQGSSTGPSAMPVRVLGGMAAGDYFGTAASGVDVNGDGYADLAIGAKSASPGGRRGAGAVVIVLGSATGLGATPASTIEGAAAGDAFGQSIAGIFRGTRVRPGVPRFAATTFVPAVGGSFFDAFTQRSFAPRPEVFSNGPRFFSPS